MEEIFSSSLAKNEIKEKTFSKLQRIQSLLKKESALKKLCKFILLKIFETLYISHKTERPN